MVGKLGLCATAKVLKVWGFKRKPVDDEWSGQNPLAERGGGD